MNACPAPSQRPRARRPFAWAALGVLLGAFLPFAAHAQTHPFIIVKDTEYAALQALSVGTGSKAPFIRMRTDAINIAATTYTETASLDSRTGAMIKIMDGNALAYIVDPANRNTYRNRFYQYLKYWDLSQNGNITAELNNADWTAGVKSSAAFFATVVAMDIIYNDPNTTAAQLTQRANFNALMEAPGVVGLPNTLGPALWFANQDDVYHDEARQSARGIWAIWKNGLSNNTALDNAVATYKQTWLNHITDDGCYVEFSGYSMARAGDPSRYNKGVFHDVIVYTGIDPNWYSNAKMGKFYEWLAGYSQAPNRYGWPIGDSSYCPFSSTYASPFDRASKFSALAGSYGEWQQNGAIPPAKLFSYLVRARTATAPVAKAPVSRIFTDGAAYLLQKNGGVNSLAAVLTNLKYFSVPNLGHMHKSTNSLSIAGFGEILLRGPGYNGYGAAATDANNFGFDFSYVNNHAISENIALFNYSISNYQNPTFTNDHRAKFGGYGVQGLLSDGLDYATSDSGLLTDANRTINNGHHIRHAIAIYPQNGINGYVYAIDELEGNSSATTGQLAWHPYGSTITVNANDSGNDRYEWQIHQKVNTTDQLYFSIFMPTAPNTKQQYDGLFADDIQGGTSTSFVGRYIFNGYTLNSTTKKKNVLTMFFPRKSTQSVPTMERITATGSGGVTSQAAAFAFGGGITDFALESDGTSERTLVSPTYDPAGAAARGKAVVYRKITTGSVTDVAFYFVGKGRSFKNTSTGFTQGFVSDADVDIHMKGTAGSVVSPGTNITFYTAGTPAARIDGALATPLSSGAGFVRVAIAAGTHTVSLEPAAPSVATTTTLVSSADPAVLGASVTFTATVTSQSGIPTGTITFADGATTLGTATLDASGNATFTTSTLIIGAHSITATYPGGGSFTGSTSAAFAQDITLADGTTRVLALDCAGAANAATGFVADTGFSTSSTSTTTNAINTSAVTNAPPAAAYQTERYAANFTYTLGGFMPSTAYLVRLHFTENFFGLAGLGGTANTVGKRLFNVSINGAQRLTAFDIYAAAGAPNKAVVREFAAKTDSSGQLVIAFAATLNNAAIHAIEVYTVTPADAWRVANFTPAQIDNPAVSGLTADPDGDGTNNLLEYALGTAPTAANTLPVTVATTTRSILDGGSEPVLTLTFFRARADIDYTVEGSFDLSQWLSVTTNPGMVGSTVTVEDTETLVTGHRFLRLRVTKP